MYAVTVPSARDRDPRIELRAAGAVEALGAHAAQLVRHAGRRERDDERAGAFEEDRARQAGARRVRVARRRVSARHAAAPLGVAP